MQATPATEPSALRPPPVLRAGPQRALTRRSLAVGLPVLLLWIVAFSFAMPNDPMLQQQLILIGGFGAVFTLFALKFLFDFLPLRHRLNAAELTFVYALLLAGIPSTVMGRLALESAVANHFLEGQVSGPRGFIPDSWAPNPHLGLVPRLDPPDTRCPYLVLPDKPDGTPRRTALPPPGLEESRRRAAEAAASGDAALAATRAESGKLAPSRLVLGALKETEDAAETARMALSELQQNKNSIEPRRAAYLAWAAETAASASRRGPQCIRNADAVNGFCKGGTAVPWQAWALPLGYWFLVMLAFLLVVVFGLMALREAWIDRERLPFPYARLAERVVQPAPAAPLELAKQESFPKLALGIAFLCGLLFCVRGLAALQDSSTTLGPPVTTFLDLDLSWLNLVKGISLRLVVLPFALLFLLFFSVDLLFTVVLFYLLAQYGIPTFFSAVGVADPGVWRYHVLRMGGMLGIAVFTAFFQRADLKRLLTGLWARTRGGTAQPLGARELSVAFILSGSVFCALVLMGQSTSNSPLLAQGVVLAYVLALVFIYNFSFIRARASGCFHYFDFNNILHAGGWLNWHALGLTHNIPLAQGSKLLEPDSVLSYHAHHQMTTFGPYAHAVGPGAQILDAFSLAESTRAHLRDILKGVLLGVVLALLIGMPLYLIAIYHVGYDNTPMAGIWNSFTLTSDKASVYYQKLLPEMFTNVSAWWCLSGALLTGACMYLRREYSRFPIEPVGIFIAGSDGGRTVLGTDWLWFTFLLVLVFKWIFFRWYGVRAFQEKVVPVAAYALMGMLLGMMLYLFLSAALLGGGVLF